MKTRRVVVRVIRFALILAGVWLLLRWFVNSLGGEIDQVYPVVAVVLFILSYLVSKIF